jgi:hypothetical protein
LATLGTFLFGPRWQCALARAIHYNDRQVRRWVGGKAAVSLYASELIEALTRDKHVHQMRRVRASYLAMVASLSDTPMRARLLAMDLAELRADDQVRRPQMGGRTPARSETPRTTSSGRAAA